MHKTRFIQAVYASHLLYLPRLTPGEFHSAAVLYGFMLAPIYAFGSHDGISFSISSRRMSEMERRLLAA